MELKKFKLSYFKIKLLKYNVDKKLKFNIKAFVVLREYVS